MWRDYTVTQFRVQESGRSIDQLTTDRLDQPLVRRPPVEGASGPAHPAFTAHGVALLEGLIVVKEKITGS